MKRRVLWQNGAIDCIFLYPCVPTTWVDLGDFLYVRRNLTCVFLLFTSSPSSWYTRGPDSSRILASEDAVLFGLLLTKLTSLLFSCFFFSLRLKSVPSFTLPSMRLRQLFCITISVSDWFCLIGQPLTWNCEFDSFSAISAAVFTPDD